MNIPITKSPGNISKFLKHIREAGVPTKVTQDYIKSVGFKSSNDSALPNVFKALGFLDASAAPTESWKAFRDASKSKAVLGQAIKQAYDGLFQIYPDAYRKDDEAIANWIRSNSSLGGTSVARAVGTFKALCAEADFANDPADTHEATVPQQPTTPQNTPMPSVTLPQTGPSVNINVELHIPATNDPKVYEHFFKAMNEHLFHDSQAK